MPKHPTAIVSHGDINPSPLEIYGQDGDVLLRIGNGGAGATGLIKELAQDYLKSRDIDGRISWVCNHSRNTQLALLKGYVDFALTYERDQEALAEAEGWSYTAGCVFHDHFCLAGPLSDPAGLASTTSLVDAFERIAASGTLFHSRADLSATMWKERAIWSLSGRTPWEDKSSWYRTSVLSPSEALKVADTAGAYFLTDRSTVLRQTGLGNIVNSTIFFEPSHAEDVLMNSCYALFSPKVDNIYVHDFFTYLVSPRGQTVIATRSYGPGAVPRTRRSDNDIYAENVSNNKIVPLTIIKGAGHEHIPIPEGECAIIADFHSVKSQSAHSTPYLTTGFYRVVPGPTRYGEYDYEETKYVLKGQIDITDEATGKTHHLVAGDWAFFHVGSKAQFSTKTEGVAFYAVTRPKNDGHPNLVGREEDVSKL
ncbi:uncharacterized protein FIESC28_02174 [Fusarium coffeatum]|uniref:Uncharacterized protein n=1 Tax=Fusarium coffeatum TaxID=231269 RepID=A0A366S8M8_9HYPO|nr:uncharacterized protein FIESC28_02174 [Fusarium coffeatum]RBR25050.1 hypothetical protein FIESC28_02174 [Fusarium coffeatum]